MVRRSDPEPELVPAEPPPCQYWKKQRAGGGLSQEQTPTVTDEQRG